MKTNFTFGTGQSNFGTLMLFFICFLFSLNSHSQKILNALTDVWKNGTWQESDQTLYTYDGNMYLTRDQTQNFNVTWIDLFKTDYINNADGTVQQSTSQLWNTTSHVWELSSRTTNTYNADKKVLTSVAEYYYDPSWQLVSKQIYSYDGNNYLTKALSQTYDLITPWKDASQITYTNNPDGTVSQSLTQIWDVSTWKDRNRVTYTYNNSKVVMELHEKWNGTIWENESKDTYDYDTNGYIIHTLTQNWNGGVWNNEEQSFATNYTNGAPHQIVSQFWNSSNAWDNTYRITFNYITLGIDDPVFEKNFAVFPNPAHDKITIKADSDNVGEKYLVTNQVGQQLLNGTITNLETVIDVNEFSSGIYLVKIGPNKILKLVKK